jgi:hypothetical protein
MYWHMPFLNLLLAAEGSRDEIFCFFLEMLPPHEQGRITHRSSARESFHVERSQQEKSKPR